MEAKSYDCTQNCVSPLTLGFGWIWLCHNDIVISEIVNSIKESVKLLSSQRQVGAGASAGGGEMVEKQRPRLFLPHLLRWSLQAGLSALSPPPAAHCFFTLLFRPPSSTTFNPIMSLHEDSVASCFLQFSWLGPSGPHQGGR